MSAKNDYLALKDVLFGRESAALEDVRALVAAHDQSIGSPEQLRESVADVLAGAMRSAGIKDRSGLAISMAPVIIDGIRSEIRNSRNEIVDALYPILGRLTSAYVMSAFRDFMEQTNQRLEGGLSGRFIWLRLYCFVTGKSYAKALLRRRSAFRVQEILLIDAETGALVDSWQAPDLAVGEPIADDGPRVTAMLAAVNRFASEALKAKRQSLKSIDLGDSQIYLRMTAKMLFVLRCEGYARASLLDVLDKAIVNVLDVHEPRLSSPDRHTAAQSARETLAALAEKVQETLSQRRRRPVFAIVLYSAFILAVLAFAGFRYWQSERLEAIRDTAASIARAYPGVLGFPVDVRFDGDGRSLILSGLVPSYSVKEGVETQVSSHVTELPVVSRLLVLPEQRKVEELQGAVSAIMDKLAAIEARIEAGNASLADLKARVAEQGETLKTVSAQVFSPQQRFTEWARRNAIFFGDGTKFRNPDIASRKIAELAAIVANSDIRLLVVGFTDSLGQSERNQQLGQERAKAVVDELVKLGVAEDRLATVSRRTETVITTETGATSNNRRVEFQLALEGE
ncbi:OmpA/MotB domain protein [Rhodomicrobium vannielii ATCC 17100]|uniref:OmpA/MotB domain protein n=1 Tax=Rhodomicrobium vannielii (strain ATCC 17100 / DSM 162 / LMG 4299 / NCIMB 10020 / ATH 3.1.1) TaxID=648757 RepID=E3I400_RHOVT|nr:OmpA family protein [Rhodomicrobium vannielii]ADP72649.1 OmpA/MotB domain protein [Rhodomicrobium vannielii ATCC 17100]